MSTYRNELGGILGSLGNIAQHLGNVLCITANHLLTDDGDDGPQPEGDTFTQAEHAGPGRGAPELQAGYRGTELEDDNGAYRLGFNNHHAH